MRDNSSITPLPERTNRSPDTAPASTAHPAGGVLDDQTNSSIVGLLSTRTWLQLMFIIAVGMIFIAFNATYRPHRTPEQNEFEQWLQATKRDLATGGPAAPTVTVALRSDRPDFKADWRLSTAGGAPTDRVVRLLDLASAANIFSRVPSPAPELMRLSVTDGVREFAATLGPGEVTTNVETANLVRLFQLYAVESPAVPETPEASDADSLRETQP